MFSAFPYIYLINKLCIFIAYFCKFTCLCDRHIMVVYQREKHLPLLIRYRLVFSLFVRSVLDNWDTLVILSQLLIAYNGNVLKYALIHSWGSWDLAGCISSQHLIRQHFRGCPFCWYGWTFDLVVGIITRWFIVLV